MYMAFRAFSGLSPLPTFTEVFLPQLAGYVKVYFPFLLLGAVFGNVMEQSGAAESIAQAITQKFGIKHSILAIVLSCTVLTYGGVSLFAVAFAVYMNTAPEVGFGNVVKVLPGFETIAESMMSIGWYGHAST